MEPTQVSLPIPTKQVGIVSLVKKKQSIKRAITYHLAGLGEKTGLVFKALERANEWLDSNDQDKIAKAMDIVLKLLPYVVEREGQVTGGSVGPNGTGVINVQINNFDTFIKDRLSHTNLGKLLSINELEQSIEVIPKQIPSTP